MLSAVRPFLNIDAGEHDDEPDELFALAHAVSVACGGHAGDDRSMRRVLEACRAHGTRAGAHPSYEDREGFGRRELATSAADMAKSVRAQCGRLAAIAETSGLKLAHVKPHGALYHVANRDGAMARAVVAAAREALGDVLVVGPPEGELRRAAEEAGVPFAREGFADRGTRADGSLVPRGEPGAVIADLDVVRAQTRALVATGAYDTLCVHGDSPGALDLARAVRAVLDP
jgi:UPF0271 protein